MSAVGQLYTSALWVTKPGKEQEFIDAWAAYVGETAKKFNVAGARLMQDRDDPTRFVSFGRWESEARIAEWRVSENFKNFLAKARELCDLAEPRNYRVVVEGS